MNLIKAINRIQTYTGEFPEKEIEWLRSHREEAIPLLLETVKNAVEAIENQQECDQELLAVLFLLSEFEVHEACSLMIKILSLDESDIDFILSDALTENYHVMLANVMTNEDIPLLAEVIENKECDEFARHCALSVLETLTAMNKISYEQLCRYFEDFLEKMQDDEEILNFFASEADHVCTDNMRKILYDAFDNKRINTQRISRLGFSFDELVEDKESHLRNENYFDNKRANIDTMKTWACYTENKEAGMGRKDFFSDMLKLRREIYTLRFPVNHSLDGMLSESRGMLLSLIARSGGYGAVDDMLRDEALEYLHKHIIDGVYDNLVRFGKEPYEFFMQCYGQDIVTINKVTERLLPVFKTGLVFGVRCDDKKINCFMTDDVKAEFDRIKADGGMDKIYLAKMNSDTAFKPVKIGRNDPCPCGSGKKYKKCCGR